MASFNTDDVNAAAVIATSSVDQGVGVWGETPSGRAIVGVAKGEGCGLWGDVVTGRSIVGVVRGGGGAGVWGETTDGAGIVGKDNAGGDGVVGEGRRGVVGKSPDYQGVYGWSRANAGVVGESEQMHGLYGISGRSDFAGVYATNRQADGCAAIFDGHVEVRAGGNIVLRGGDLILGNADCAEDFDVVDECEPGTVVVAVDELTLRASEKPYDRRVAGVVSGAGGFRPGIVLDRPQRSPRRSPIALVGKVFCKVDASQHPVAVGDLLTTSSLCGHAMKATDPTQAFGAVIGKSLGTLSVAQGLVPVLVALQ